MGLGLTMTRISHPLQEGVAAVALKAAVSAIDTTTKSADKAISNGQNMPYTTQIILDIQKILKTMKTKRNKMAKALDASTWRGFLLRVCLECTVWVAWVWAPANYLTWIVLEVATKLARPRPKVGQTLAQSQLTKRSLGLVFAQRGGLEE